MSSTYLSGDDPTTRELPRVAPSVRGPAWGRAEVRPLHSVPNDRPALPEPRRRDDARHTGSPTVLWASLAAGGAFVLAVAGGLALFLQADEMDERVRVVGWVVVLCAFLVTLTCGAVAVLVHDRRKDRARQHDEFFAFVEQASAAANARYQRLLDGQAQVRETLREELCGEVDAASRRVLAALQLHLQRVPRQGLAADVVARLDRIEETLEHSSQRAWWLGYAQGTRDQSTDGTVAQLPVRR